MSRQELLDIALKSLSVVSEDVNPNDFISEYNRLKRYTAEYIEDVSKRRSIIPELTFTVEGKLDTLVDKNGKPRSNFEIVPEDQERFLGIVNKENLVNEISKGNIVKVTYRLIIDGKPEFVELSAMKLSSDTSHIILAVTSIDSWKKKEDEYNKKLNQEKLLSRTDGLTNTLNKFAYKEIEKKINKEIKNDSIDEFSVFVFDINNLKTINDTLGHEAGDKYIKSAKRLIKKIFKQDDLYRIGGDEFALILNNSDYYIRDFLYEKINLENQKNKSLNKVTVAVGMADYNKDTDSSLVDVFKKADDRMYEYKKEFKRQ